MPETTPPNIADAGSKCARYFVRGRNALLARAEFGDLFVDYYFISARTGFDGARARCDVQTCAGGIYAAWSVAAMERTHGLDHQLSAAASEPLSHR